jgi:predicted nucleotidyltransferase component of viral defense system
MQDLKNLDCLLPKTRTLLLMKIDKFNLASIEQIAAIKAHVLFLRAKYRDYYDLYFLARERLGLREIFRLSENIIEGMTYKLFVTALLYIDDIEDDDISYLEPKEKITKSQIRDFFQKRV